MKDEEINGFYLFIVIKQNAFVDKNRSIVSNSAENMKS